MKNKTDVEQFQEFSEGVKKSVRDGLVEDKLGYNLLVERVREFDASAATFLQFQACMLPSFRYHSRLVHCFYWASTPQGEDYWLEIYLSMTSHQQVEQDCL